MDSQNTKDAIEDIICKLAITRTQLAAMIGVSERALSDWANKPMSSLTTEKGSRFLRLQAIVQYLCTKITDKNTSLLRRIIEDGRVPMDGVEDDSISLISYICANPGDAGWRANADAALAEYMGYLKGKDKTSGIAVQ